MKLSRRQWNIVIKSVIIIAFGWILVQRFSSADDLLLLRDTLVSQWRKHSPWLILLAITMMPLNWILESIKWRLLMRPAIILSWKRAIAGVLSGITFSLFMPNRIGEYGGRILHVDAKHHWHAVMASLAGSFAQNLIHVSIGVSAAILLFGRNWDLPHATWTGLIIMAIIIILLSGIGYFFLPSIAQFMHQWKPPGFLKRPWKALSHLGQLRRRQLGLALLISLGRYVVFSTQYIILLWYFGVNVPLVWLAGGVAVIYLMHTSIPLPPFIDLIARNELGIFLWAGFGVHEQSIVLAGLMIWILNLAIPALCGLLAIASVNILRSIGYKIETVTTTSA